MVDSVSVVATEDGKLKESLVSEDSVPTDLTVSVTATSQDQEISEISNVDTDKRIEHGQLRQEIVKRLRSELQVQKLLSAQKNAETENILAEKGQEIELLKQHIKLSTKEIEGLKKENSTLSEEILELQTKTLRLLSENKVLEENAAKAKETISGLESKLTELSDRHKQTLLCIENGEFTYEKFEQLKVNANSLDIKYQALGRENVLARKSAEKWRKKFTKLRNQYDNRLQEEVLKIRQSLQKQIEMLRTTGAEFLETRLLESEQQRDKAVQDAMYWKNVSEKLKSKVRASESIEDKLRSELEHMQSTKNELAQRMNSVATAKMRLERELAETKRESQMCLDSLRKDISSQEQRIQQYQLCIENQAKSLQEYEESFLTLHGIEEESNRLPTLLKIQLQHANRMTKKVAQLEAENETLQKQKNLQTSKTRQLELELESKEKIISQIQSRAPETIGLFRDKDTLLRELRSQLNQKELQLMEYARQVERLKKTRKQLASDLEEVLRDRSALETVKQMLTQS